MSGVNNKASKESRILVRIGELSDRQLVIDDLLQTVFRQQGVVESQQKTIKSQQLTMALAVETANRLDAENARLRKYLGSVLFERRQRDMQIPTLSPMEPSWSNREPGAKPLPPEEIPHIAIRGL